MNVNKIIIAALCCAFVACGREPVELPKVVSAPIISSAEVVLTPKIVEDPDAVLGQYVINMMYATPARTKLSEAKKQVLARAIVRVTKDVFESDEHRKAFVAVLAIESGFDRSAQSPTGPRGLGQLAKKAFFEGLASCGVADVKEDDIWDTDINLYAGACYFRTLLEQNNSDPYFAIVAYNQGPNSEAAKGYAKHGHLENLEALKYVARFSYLKRVVPEVKAPNVPAIKDLPQVQKPLITEGPKK